MRTQVARDEMNAEEKGMRLLRIWGIYLPGHDAARLSSGAHVDL